MFLYFSDVTTLSMGVLNYFTSIYSYSCYIYYIWWNSIYSHLHIVYVKSKHMIYLLSQFPICTWKVTLVYLYIYFCHVFLKNLKIFGVYLLKFYLCCCYLYTYYCKWKIAKSFGQTRCNFAQFNNFNFAQGCRTFQKQIISPETDNLQSEMTSFLLSSRLN